MNLWIVGLVALLVTCAAAPMVRRWLIRHEVLDRPNDRSSHRVAVPRGGGIACVLGVITGTVIAAATGHDVAWNVLLAALMMALIGFLDDRFQLPAAPRLVSQILIGALLGALLGGVLWSSIGAIAVPLFVNVVNFMDGINGITALTLGLWGATAAVTGAAYESPALTTLGVVTAGTALGFLPWNAPRAKVFLGDVGSYLFGALAGGGVLLGSAGGVPPVLLVAPLSVYILDVVVALVKRAVRNVALTQAHREHVYQRMVDELQAPHLFVSAWTTAVALGIVVAWVTGPAWLAITLTSVLLSLYLGSVSVGRWLASMPTEAREVLR